MNLACPAVSRTGGTSKSGSAFNEGVSVPQRDWDAIVKRNPALTSQNKLERAEATKKAVLHGELAKYRRR